MGLTHPFLYASDYPQSHKLNSLRQKQSFLFHASELLLMSLIVPSVLMALVAASNLFPIGSFEIPARWTTTSHLSKNQGQRSFVTKELQITPALRWASAQ